MLGQSFAGKTSLLYRFVTDNFSGNYMNTVGVDLKTVTLQIQDNTLARVNIWDTTGQEKFRSLTKAYFRNCQGAVAVFDLTVKDTLYSLEAVIREFRNLCPQEASENVVLVGNKVDLAETHRQVTVDEALEFSKRMGLLGYFETSASQNQNVDNFFYTVVLKAFEIE
jgi:small GTP-binding protein